MGLPGPWTLTVQREINGAFRSVTSAVIDTPGFGASITDTSAPTAALQLTYRVCTVDDSGTLDCGKPLGSPSCITCEPFSCQDLRTCDITTSNGCSNIIICGACPNGGTCNRTIFGEHTCCGPGLESDGLGGCECAPLKPCPPRYEWEAAYCECRPIR